MLDSLVTPFIQKNVGAVEAKALLDFTPVIAHQLIISNIPLLFGFTATVTTAAANAIPNYSSSATFNNTVDRTINGHLFYHTAWIAIERSALLTPGMLYLAETNADINMSFNLYGRRLNLSTPLATDNLKRIKDYLYLPTSNRWFGELLQTSESRSFAGCITTKTLPPLLTIVLPKSDWKFDHIEVTNCGIA